jgi:hypothetical protein
VGSVSAKRPLAVSEEAGEVIVYGRIYPRRFNAAREVAAARYHFLVWNGGSSRGALVETPADDLAFHDALLRLGASPGNNVPAAAWERRLDPRSSAPLNRVEGSALWATLFWEGGEPEGVPLHRVFRGLGSGAIALRFAGNRAGKWASMIPGVPRAGCLVCLYSCPSGKVGNGALTIRDYVEEPARFIADLDALPPEGTPVVVKFRLAR